MLKLNTLDLETWQAIARDGEISSLAWVLLYALGLTAAHADHSQLSLKTRAQLWKR